MSASRKPRVLKDLEFEEDPDPPVGVQGPVNFDLEENDTASEAPNGSFAHSAKAQLGSRLGSAAFRMKSRPRTTRRRERSN